MSNERTRQDDQIHKLITDVEVLKAQQSNIKDDLLNIRQDTKEDISSIREETKEMREDLKGLSKKIDANNKWMIGMFLTSLLTLLGMIYGSTS